MKVKWIIKERERERERESEREGERERIKALKNGLFRYFEPGNSMKTKEPGLPSSRLSELGSKNY